MRGGSPTRGSSGSSEAMVDPLDGLETEAGVKQRDTP